MVPPSIPVLGMVQPSSLAYHSMFRGGKHHAPNNLVCNLHGSSGAPQQDYCGISPTGERSPEFDVERSILPIIPHERPFL